MSDYLVSVLVPVYGVEKYIERCARSLFNQTYSNIEFVFINDCTKDKSIDILHDVMNDYPALLDRIHIVEHDKNRGLAAARNTGIKHASGEFVFWVDSDDSVDCNAIELCVKSQTEFLSDIVITNVFKQICDGDVYVNQVNSSDPITLLHHILRDECEHWIWGKLIRKSLYIDNNIEALEGANMGEDFQVFPQLVLFSKTISYVDKPLYFYNMTNVSSYGHSVKENIQYQRWDSYNVLLARINMSEFVSDLVFQKMQMVYFQLKTFFQSTGSLSITYYNFLIDKITDEDLPIVNNMPLYKRYLILKAKRYGKINSVSDLPIGFISFYIYCINILNSLRNWIVSRFSHK